MPSTIVSSPDQTRANSEQTDMLVRIITEGERIFKKSHIYERLMGKCAGDISTANKHEAWGLFLQMLIFLWISQIKPKGYRCSPVKAIDAVWHEFMLFSEEYTEFCMNTVGHYIHHRPFTSVNQAEIEAMPQWLPEIRKIREFVGGGFPFIATHWINMRDSSDCVDVTCREVCFI